VTQPPPGGPTGPPSDQPPPGAADSDQPPPDPWRRGPWERREFWRRQQREFWQRQSHERQPRWGNGSVRWEGAPPWSTGRPPGLAWLLRRFAGVVLGLIVVVIITTAVAGWVLGSIVGLARVAGVAVVGLGLWSIVRRVRSLAGPIDELADATRQIEDGDYTVRVREPAGAGRQLRELSVGFNTMAARLETDERQRRSLLADVSHELRTPLAVVQGNVEALVDGVHPADPAHLGAILDETRVLSRLVDDLRTLALSEAGTLLLHPEPTDVGLLVADVARSFETVAAAAGSTISLVAADWPNGSGAAEADLPLLEVDPIRIREVLSNLVTNALRYSPVGGQVAISIALENGGRWLRVEVRDQGPGLDPGVAASIFDRFAKSAESGGSGLGLAIARHLVEAHGGEIGLTSPTGGGTTAWFRLPIDDG
jgi:two-component system sensor histidine kinase BaeS